jgi:hypothetical protein
VREMVHSVQQADRTMLTDVSNVQLVWHSTSNCKKNMEWRKIFNEFSTMWESTQNTEDKWQHTPCMLHGLLICSLKHSYTGAVLSAQNEPSLQTRGMCK